MEDLDLRAIASQLSSSSTPLEDVRLQLTSVQRHSLTLPLQEVKEAGLAKAVKALLQHSDGRVKQVALEVMRTWKERNDASRAPSGSKTVAAASTTTTTITAATAAPLALPGPSLMRLPGVPQQQQQQGFCDAKDYSSGTLRLKPDHAHKPFWVCPDLRIILESHSPVYKQAEDFLIAIAEPKSRTRYLHEYQLSEYSLYAGASMGETTSSILEAMDRFSKTELPPQVRQTIHEWTSRYGKVKLVMASHQLFVECPRTRDSVSETSEVLQELLCDPVLEQFRPLLRLDRFQLRVLGRHKKVFNGSGRFLPSELVASFDHYRRVELKYCHITAIHAIARVAGRDVAGLARYELRFRLSFASDDDLKKLHNTLALESKEFDASNPVYDPLNASHELCFGFASETDRRRFGAAVLPRIREQQKQIGTLIPAPSVVAVLDAWEAEGDAAAAAAGDGAAASGGNTGDGNAGDGNGELVAAEGDDENDAVQRRAEGDDDGQGLFTDRSLFSFEVDSSKVMEVKTRCRELRWPLLEEYDFRNDTANPVLPIERKTDDLRDYQTRALARVFGNHRARSGIIVLPCGSGKTLVGITAACTVKRSTLVLCNSSVSVEQWYQQFMMWAKIDKDRVTRFTADKKEPLHKEACVLISTYNMIGYTGRRSDEARLVMADVSDREWGLVILDEVHVAPADTFLTCMTTRTRSRCKLGLTATLVREDGKIDVLNAQIGPKLYEANWLDLQQRGFIANVSCAEVWCEMAPAFYREYLRAKPATGSTSGLQRLLYAMNPNKFRTCEYLMRFHEARGDKILIFSDSVFALREYARQLKRPWIDGDVKQNERMRVLSQFKSGGAFSTVLISKVGDTSIDLPEANVIIQIASHFGARRQEAQRLGRILRPKARSSADAFNAFFYTLISRDTHEMFYSGKRQQFLVDQGYAFKVITELTGMDADEGLSYGTTAEQLDLLGHVLTHTEAQINNADENEDAEINRALDRATAEGGGAGSGAQRRTGNMQDLSGGGGALYHEKTGAQSKLVRDIKRRKT